MRLSPQVKFLLSTILLTGLAPQDQLASTESQSVQLVGLAASADGKWLATGGDAVRVFHAKTGHQYRSMMTKRGTNQLRFSPTEDKAFVVGGGDRIYFVRVGANQPHSTISLKQGSSLRSLTYSPDGKRLTTCVSRYDNGVVVESVVTTWDASEKTKLHEHHFDAADCTALAYSADGTFLAIAAKDNASRDSRIEVFRTSDWQSIKRIAMPLGFALSMSFTSDGKRLVMVGGECEDRSVRGCMTRGKFWFANLDSDNPAKLFRPFNPTVGYFRGAHVGADGQSFLTCTSVSKVGPGGGSYSQTRLQSRSMRNGQVLWQDSRNGSEAGGSSEIALVDSGSIAAYCVGSRIHLIDMKTGESTRMIAAKPAKANK
ncbi:MAG: WD40 repeat domain-containing protein [Planctomycetaceae bacterium]